MNELQIWEKLTLCRQFELKLAKSYAAKQLPQKPIYLSIGQEYVPAVVTSTYDWMLPDKPNIFPQHRCHSWFLASGGSPDALLKEIVGSPSGCSGGMGGSASVHNLSANLYGHSGLLGDQVPIAAGMALGTNRITIVVLGDAAAEEDYVLATLGFAATKKLPLLFIVEDNNLSILTKKEVRRSWSIVEVAHGFGIPAYEVEGAIDLWEAIQNVGPTLPGLINVRVDRHYWHAGAGQDWTPTNDVYEEYRSWITSHSGPQKVKKIEHDIARKLNQVWADNGYSS